LDSRSAEHHPTGQLINIALRRVRATNTVSPHHPAKGLGVKCPDPLIPQAMRDFLKGPLVRNISPVATSIRRWQSGRRVRMPNCFKGSQNWRATQAYEAR